MNNVHDICQASHLVRAVPQFHSRSGSKFPFKPPGSSETHPRCSVNAPPCNAPLQMQEVHHEVQSETATGLPARKLPSANSYLPASPPGRSGRSGVMRCATPRLFSGRQCSVQFAKTAGRGVEGFVGCIQCDLRVRSEATLRGPRPGPLQAPTSWRHHSNFSRRCFASIFASVRFTSPLHCMTKTNLQT